MNNNLRVRDLYKPGDNYVICERTGAKAYASECRMEWNGNFVRKEVWDMKHPQLSLKGISDDQTVSVSRSRASNTTFLSATEVTEDSF